MSNPVWKIVQKPQAKDDHHHACFRCDVPFREGDQVTTWILPFQFKWPKQRVKAKGNTSATFVIHERCKK